MTPIPNLVQIRPQGGFWANRWNITRLTFFLFWHIASCYRRNATRASRVCRCAQFDCRSLPSYNVITLQSSSEQQSVSHWVMTWWLDFNQTWCDVVSSCWHATSVMQMSNGVTKSSTTSHEPAVITQVETDRQTYGQTYSQAGDEQYKHQQWGTSHHSAVATSSDSDKTQQRSVTTTSTTINNSLQFDYFELLWNRRTTISAY